MHKLKLILATAALMVFGNACRLGNYSDTAKPLNNIGSGSGSSSLKNVELFFTEPKTFNVVAIYQDTVPATPPTQNPNTPLVAIPGDVLNTFTDPVYLAWSESSTGVQKPYFLGVYSPDTYNLPSVIDSSGTVNSGYADPMVQVTSTCSTQVQRLQVGDLDRSELGSFTFPDGTHQTVSGHLDFDFTYMRVFIGDCGNYLQTLANCYLAGSTCSNDQLSVAHAYFDLAIQQSGVLRVSDAAKLKGLAYIVHFE